MKLKKLSALLLTLLLCVMILPADVSAAETKGIKLSKSSATMTVGDTLTLKRTVTGITKGTVQWGSSDKSVAAVSKGVVTAKKAGTVTITAKIKGTKYKATCKITVKAKSKTTDKTETKKDTANKSDTNKDTDNKSDNEKKNSSKDPAQKLVDKITIGWNLGNTFDSIDVPGGGLASETGWGNPKTTKAMITAVKNAGFNTIRIPVSWGEHMDARGNVDTAWMDRVQEVVDYAYDNNMYIILNTHHDESWLKFNDKESAESIKKFTHLWEQISDRFKNYDQHLIFEGLNEPRTKGSAKEWTGGTSAEWKILNDFYTAFVKTVRGSGGNNKTRLLMLTTYGANSSYDTMSALEIPDDDMIAVSIHAYIPYFAAFDRNSKENKLTDGGKNEINYMFENIDKVFLSKGIPVIIDEFGSINKSNTNERIEIAKYYLSVAESYGVPCCWWDNGANCLPEQGEGFGLLNRNTLDWYYPDLVKALTESVK